MNLYFIGLILVTLIGIKINIKGFNKDYMDKEHTTCINGFFILVVLYSHLETYIDVHSSKDLLMLNFRDFLLQLMVTMFLFNSGYGIYYQIKKKKEEYVKSLPKNRIFKTYIKFFIAITTFLIVNLIFGIEMSKRNIVLAYTGWESIGNSNWYIFSMVVMYILTYLSFRFVKDIKKGLVINTIICIIYVVLISRVKESWWYITLLCYPLGMIYSNYKEKIDKLLFNNKRYFIILIGLIIIFFVIRLFDISNPVIFEIMSLVFVLIVALITMKIDIRSKILYWLGSHLFWIYILQRIPMNILRKLGYTHAYRFALISIVGTFILAIIYSFIFDKRIDKLFNKKRNKT